MNSARILLADDDCLAIEGMCAMLQPQHEVVAVVKDGPALLAAAVRLAPDLVLLEVKSPLFDGLDTAAEIGKIMPGSKLLFVTMHTNPAYLAAAFKASGRGYLLKSASHEELLTAVRLVVDGFIYITPSLWKNWFYQDATPSQRLSTLEKGILQLISEGRTAREIASLMMVSKQAIESHRERIKKKLGLRCTAELTRHAFEQGLERLPAFAAAYPPALGCKQ
jgi:DNA-binding NarL/FixJ family response regulator